MDIKLEGSNGKIYEAHQEDQNTFVVLIGVEKYKIKLFYSESKKHFTELTKIQKERMTKAILENDEIKYQLKKSVLTGFAHRVFYGKNDPYYE